MECNKVVTWVVTRFMIVDYRGASVILGRWVDNTQPIDRGTRIRGVGNGNFHESVTKIFSLYCKARHVVTKIVDLSITELRYQLVYEVMVLYTRHFNTL